jgi:dihydrofolate reductase
MIAAVGKNLELGKDNKLLWHLPEDLKFFKEQTMGKPIIMGKKTLDSLPRLLPGRLHLVLTHQQLEETDQVKVFRDLDSLVEFIKELNQVPIQTQSNLQRNLMTEKALLQLAVILNFYEIDLVHPLNTIIKNMGIFTPKVLICPLIPFRQIKYFLFLVQKLCFLITRIRQYTKR